ncbi:MAG: cyclic nucleotide-binding domain-containing protein [Bdellovibrionota bacterium]|jgi:serine/threonine protein phosphatase PrpC
MKTQGYAKSDIGLVRPHNEDYYICNDKLGLYIVCDGVGGNAAGEVASKTAAETTQSYISQHIKDLDDIKENREAALIKLVEDGIQEACATVYKLAQENKTFSGMATTLTLLLIRDSKAVMGHVGDSRLYLKRGESVNQLSNDHTFVNELFQQGCISEEALESSPYANVITRSIGHEPCVQVDTLLFDTLPQDLFLLCSDGFTKELSPKTELPSLLTTESLKDLPDKLITVATERGGHDNCTIVIIENTIIDDSTENRSKVEEHTKEVMLRLGTLKQLNLFQSLTLRELLTVMEIISVEQCPKGTKLITEGAEGSYLYIILEGEFSVSKCGQHLSTLGSGKHFGEMALLNNNPRTATVTAETDGRMLVIEHQSFQRLLTQHSDIGVKLLFRLANELCKRLDDANLHAIS